MMSRTINKSLLEEISTKNYNLNKMMMKTTNYIPFACLMMSLSDMASVQCADML
jgi:hypothetical protein